MELGELKLLCKVSPTVDDLMDQDRLLFSASLGESPEAEQGHQPTLVQARVAPDTGLGPWNTEHGTQRESGASIPPRHCQAFEVQA